jgi:hypothetical protein
MSVNLCITKRKHYSGWTGWSPGQPSGWLGLPVVKKSPVNADAKISNDDMAYFCSYVGTEMRHHACMVVEMESQSKVAGADRIGSTDQCNNHQELGSVLFSPFH